MAKNRQDKPQTDPNPIMPPVTEPAIEAAEAIPDRVRLVLIRPAALGFGTRPAGFVLGTAESLSGGWKPETVQAAEGVESIELRNGLLNPHLIEPR